MTEHRVVVVGEARVDEIRDPGGVRESVTGDAVELATALLGYGLVLTVVAPVAEDADGDRIRAALQDRGIRLVSVPAPEGTLRRSIVRDRGGVEIELRRGESAFTDTRRSLAAQAEADLIVDFRERVGSTTAEVRDEVLSTFGLGAPVAESPAPRGGDSAAVVPAAAQPAANDARVPEAPPQPEAVAAPAAVLLPAPIVAGTHRHAPVRLLPDPPAAHAPAPDWHGLEARLARIAT
ncbi:hypothetical protein ACIPY5_06930 [Microbacterium sp. NPDC089698]|uniref:hypothetical protein n=1 Tax=Microbacterium sp. NPDC089698 TaxID=3364200 RepID=UPI0037FF86B9